MQRFGQVIGLREDRVREYDEIHANVWPDVLALINTYHIQNYSIFRDGTRLFAYFEYVGDDYEADMAAMGAEPVNLKWWELTEPMQVPDPDREPGEWWKSMTEVFHLE